MRPGEARVRFDSSEVSTIPKLAESSMVKPRITATSDLPARFDSTVFSEYPWSEDGWKAIDERVSRGTNESGLRGSA